MQFTGIIFALAARSAVEIAKFKMLLCRMYELLADPAKLIELGEVDPDKNTPNHGCFRFEDMNLNLIVPCLPEQKNYAPRQLPC